MEGTSEGIEVAAAAGHESGDAPFGADVSMTDEAQEQEAAATATATGKEYHFISPSSSPSTSSTPSPPPPAVQQQQQPGQQAAAGAGDDEGNGARTAAAMQGGECAGPSSGRRRGRPRGSGRRQILASLGEWYALSAGGSFTPHVIIMGTGEDVAARIMSFSHKGPRSVCILSANGTVSNVTFRNPDSSSANFTYEGQFEILRLNGSFTTAEEGGRKKTGGLSVTLACPDGRVVGGVVAGVLRAASPIQVVVGSFLPNSPKQHKRRMNLQQQQHPSPPTAPAAPALIMAPSPVLTLTPAMPISSQLPTPGGNGFHAPPPPPSADPGSPSVNLNTAAASPAAPAPGFGFGFTMVGWPPATAAIGSSSPDINVSLTPDQQE